MKDRWTLAMPLSLPGDHANFSLFIAPDAVSINYCDVGLDGTGSELDWLPLNVTELAHPYPNSELASRYGCSNIPTASVQKDNFTVMENALYSLPMGLTAVDPAYKSCDVDIFGYDPPRTLSRVSAMVGPTTQPAAISSTLNPGARISLPHSPTSTPPVDPSTSLLPNPTASGIDGLNPLGLIPSKADPAQSKPPVVAPKPVTNSPQSVSGDPRPLPTVDPNAGTHPSTGHDQGQNAQGPSNPVPDPDPSPQPSQKSNETPNGQDPKTLQPKPEASSTPSSEPNEGGNDQHLGSPSPIPKSVVIGDQTFSPGSTPVVVAGTTHSIAAPAGTIFINGQAVSRPPDSAPSQSLVISIGSQIVPFSINSASETVMGSQTLQPESPIIIASHTIVADPSAGHGGILVDGQPTILPSVESDTHDGQSSPAPSSLTVGGQTITTNDIGQLMVGSQTLRNGGPAIFISGTPVSVAPASQITVDGSTLLISPPSPTIVQQVTIGGHVMTTNSAGDYMIGSSVLHAGSPAITISGTPVSLDASGSQIIIGSSTVQLAPPVTPMPGLQIGDHTIPYFINSASEVIIAGSKTLSPGGPPVTISNTPISLVSSGDQLLVGSSTVDINPSSTLVPSPTLSVGSTTLPYSVNSAGDLIIAGSQTLIPGAPAITISNTPLSLAPSATALIVGSSTIPLSPFRTLEKPLSIGGSTLSYSINTYSDLIIIGSQTLTPGGSAAVISGATVSAVMGGGTSGPEVVVGQGASKTTEGLGDVIMSGFGAVTTPTGSAGVGGSSLGASPSASTADFKGGAARRMDRRWETYLLWAGVAFVGGWHFMWFIIG